MSDRLQVFGYGGLLWKDDLEYSKYKIGYIKGYQRRFWQGSITHRGTEDNWGRVATLIKTDNSNDRVWGCMYVVTDKKVIAKEKAKLEHQEISTGEYEAGHAHFHPRGSDGTVYKVVVYIAGENNRLFWREDDIKTMARQVVGAEGFAGPNTEYVTKIADFMRANIPEEHDQHLFALDERVREIGQIPER